MINNEKIRALRLKRKENGLCVRCGEKARNGLTLCKACAEKVRAAQIRCLQNPQRRALYLEKNRITNKARREFRSTKGLCPECGAPNNSGYWCCDSCREKRAECVRRFRERKRGYEK